MNNSFDLSHLLPNYSYVVCDDLDLMQLVKEEKEKNNC